MKRGRSNTLICILDRKILDYLNKNNSCCITDLIKKWGSGSQNLIKHFDYLLKVKLINKIKKDKSCQKDYSLNEDKRKEIDFILGLPEK
jgi:hypothetical protein